MLSIRARGTIAKTIDLPGDVVGFYEAALHSKVTGYLKSYKRRQRGLG